MQSARRRSLPVLTIPQTERWIQDTQVKGNINYLSNPDAIKGVNEVPTVRTRKQTEKGSAYSLKISNITVSTKTRSRLDNMDQKSTHSKSHGWSVGTAD